VTLYRYSGQGRCRKLECCDESAYRYREKLRAWAVSRNWTVTLDKNEDGFIIERVSKQEERP